jgi:hypothetical protein
MVTPSSLNGVILAISTDDRVSSLEVRDRKSQPDGCGALRWALAARWCVLLAAGTGTPDRAECTCMGRQPKVALSAWSVGRS